MASTGLAFLFGAGISLKSGLPSCAEITNRLLSAEGIFRHTDENYYIGSPPNPATDRSRAYLERIRLLLQMLKTEADTYYFGDRRTNYEDLFFMVYQVWAALPPPDSSPVGLSGAALGHPAGASLRSPV